jgi:hypothetical protein
MASETSSKTSDRDRLTRRDFLVPAAASGGLLVTATVPFQVSSASETAEAILDGRQSNLLTLAKIRSTQAPLDWSLQRDILAQF